MVSTEVDNTPDVSDLESDMEPDQLVSKYVYLMDRLFNLQADASPLPKKKGKGKAKSAPPALTGAVESRAVTKLRQQVMRIESDVLFDSREGDAQWNIRRTQLLQEGSVRRRLDLLKPISVASSDTDEQPESHDEEPRTSLDEPLDADVDLMGGMFAEPGDKIESAPPDSQLTDSGPIALRDFGQASGLTPRRILEDACRSRDSSAKLSYKLVSPTTYSSRHSVTIQWSKAQNIPLEVEGVELQQSRRSMTFTAITIAAVNAQQSEGFVSVVALFAIFSTSPKEEKLYLRLPSTWRDIWQELAASQKIKDDAADRQTLKEMRLLVREKRERDEDGGVVLSHRSRTKNRSPEKGDRMLDVNNLEPDDSLKTLWARKASTNSYKQMQHVRLSLPIAGYRSEILAAIEKNQVVILCGETGCGKSTQLPAFILEHELSQGKPCRIYCTEPRRISAISLAQRVSEELGEAKNEVGTASSLVGYAIRLESHVAEQTRLVYATVGIVLRMLESDTALRDVTHLIIDEVHERSIDTDFLLIIIKTMLETRRSLKVVLMSATVDAQKFSSYLDDAPILTVPGRTFPVKTLYLEDALELTKLVPTNGEKVESDEDNENDFSLSADGSTKESKAAYLESLQGYSASTVKGLVNGEYDEYRIDYVLIVRLIEEVATNPQFSQYNKAYLVFLPGIAEIRELNDILQDHPKFGADWSIYPLHSTIASEDQQQAFVVPPPGIKKVVLATNIAETGITIPDITCVIDSGKHKEMRFDERRQLSRLLQAFVSRSNAKQRRGRAGRVQEGLCFHLFTKYRHDKLIAENQTPELLRLSLQDLVMRVKICKLGDIEQTLAQALDPPIPKTVRKAIDALVDVGALTATENLTPLGQQLAKLPLDAILGKFCLLACTFSCVDVAVTIAAILSSKSPFLTPFGARQKADSVRLGFKRGDSDLLTAYNAYSAWRKICSTPGQSEFVFCRRNFLSPQNLSNIEDLKSQLLNSLLDAGSIQISREDRQALNKYRYSSRHRTFVPVPTAYNINSNNDDLVNSVIAWAFYPKLLVRDGKGWRNVANNQSVSVHPSSVNKANTAAKLLSYYSIMQSNTKSPYNAHSTNLVHELPIVLFAGNADFRLHAGIVIIDGNRMKFSFRDWKTMIAVKLLRSKVKDIVNAKLKFPPRPLGQKLDRWVEVVQEVFETNKEGDALVRKGK